MSDDIEVQDLPGLLGRSGRILALDLGTKTIGLALSDPARTVATPLETIKRTKFTKDAIALDTVIQEWDIAALILGLPRNMDGSEGPRCQSTRQFARNLKHRGLTLPVSFWDERLSTSAVERFLVQGADMTRKRRGEVVDKMAAAYILQGALETMRNASLSE